MVLRRRYPQAYRPVRSGDCGHKQSILANLPNFKELTNTNGGLVYLAYFLACFPLLIPLKPQPCFKPSAGSKTWKQHARGWTKPKRERITYEV